MKIVVIGVFLLVVSVHHLAAQTVTDTRAGNPTLREELLRMAEADQDVREVLTEKGFASLDSLDVSRIHAVDAENLKRLKQVVRTYGWPTGEMVGKDGVHAAFLLVQHADLDPAFQKVMLPHVEASFRAGDLEGRQVALLTDRVLRNEGKPQRYGTQVIVEDGKARVLPLENEDQVDVWRAEMGLPPLAEYLEMFKDVYGLEN